MPAFPEQRPVKFGRYVLLDRINVGGMAEVFRGKTSGVEGFERMVALKRILPSIAQDQDFVDMFIDEAKLAVQLQHANIAQIYDLGKAEDMYYIAMEYVSGVDLRTMWDRARHRNRLLPIAMSCYIMQRCCEGLDAAHRKKDQEGRDIGLVHRDVSPQNILVSFEGEVKVIDFGIAKSKSKVSKTQAGILKGKFGYMSPEQVRGVELDNRSDIFACGAVLYELVVGDRLFLGESDFSTLEKVRNVEMVPPTRLNKNLSPHLERIVMKALAKNREDRYRWASEMAEDLQRYLFSSNQPFARTDLQRYMQQHFKEELEKEKERLDRYKTITFSQFDEPEPRQSSRAGAELQSGIMDIRGGAPERSASMLDGSTAVGQLAPGAASALKARPIPLAADGLPVNGGAGASLPPGYSQSMPPMSMAQHAAKPRIPPWAAGLIGGLVAVVMVALGVVFYLAKAKPAPGSIVLEVTPTRADVYLNDKLVANSTPFTLDNLVPNTYVLTVKKDGYEPLIRAIVVAEGEQRREMFELEKTKGSASLIVRSEPAGLAVWIDGQDTGRVTPATITELASGDHHVLLKRGDVVVTKMRRSVADGGNDIVEVDTAKLPPIIDVTSKPAGGAVLVNGEPKGTTPQTIVLPKAGAVKVVVQKPGCKAAERTASVERATWVDVAVELDCAP
ncbi:protein kinase [Myxococcota bacterium]|nr:protein kinase [Myxococcota bacterium]